MKTRDLMQSDLVYETLLEDTPQVVTVEEVGQNHIYIGMEDDDMALLRYEPKYLGWNIEHIEPIPLTEEILKSNLKWLKVGIDYDKYGVPGIYNVVAVNYGILHKVTTQTYQLDV